MSRLADRLSTARHDLFVGRVAEQAVFRTALEAAELPFSLLYIYGLGGMGKTTLLHEFRALCQSAAIGTAFVDARNIEPIPEAFYGALALALGLDVAASPRQFLEAQAQRYVILIDTYEMLSPLDNWIREEFLPQLPDNILVVLAGRQPLAPGWRIDAGWHNLARTLSLRNLSPRESRAYLDRREVPAEQHQAVLDFTHGHPLALSLIADLFWQRHQEGSAAVSYAPFFQPEQAPDVVKVLLEHLVQGVPSEAHRAALEACALARLTTEELLAEMLDAHLLDSINAHELFQWLRDLSFIEAGLHGIFPHDLAREAMLADLRWRNPDHYGELHRRARNYYAPRLQQTSGPDQERILFDYIFLHRDNPVVRPYLDWQESGTLTRSVARPAELPDLVALVERYEGAASARLATHWFARQPQGINVIHDAEGHIAGFVMIIALNGATPEDIKVDPATDAAWRYLATHAPLRAGENAPYFRFWMAHDTYQEVSAIQSLIFVSIVRYYLTTPGLAFSFFSCADAEFWLPIFAYGDIVRLPAAEYAVGTKNYGIYGHDWRLVPPLAWLSLLAEREITATSELPPATPTIPHLVVLSQTEFAAAVQEALKDLTRPAALRHNALLRSRLVVERTASAAHSAERIATLQSLVTEVCEVLKNSPRESKFYQALYHAYLHPAPSQEQAATLIDTPFSTFRRHLKTGVLRVTELLWQREIGA